MSETTIAAGWANPTDLSRLYAVDMGCRHVEMRRMKPSSAAAVMSPDGQIRREEICGACRAERDAVEVPALVAKLAGGAR